MNRRMLGRTALGAAVVALACSGANSLPGGPGPIDPPPVAHVTAVPDSLPDPTGIRAFVVGSGGASLYSFSGAVRNSAARMSAYGVLKLTLRFDNYDYAFIEAGTEVTRDSDVGQACH